MLKCYSYIFFISLLRDYLILLHTFFSVGDDFKVEMLNEWWWWLIVVVVRQGMMR